MVSQVHVTWNQNWTIAKSTPLFSILIAIYDLWECNVEFEFILETFEPIDMKEGEIRNEVLCIWDTSHQIPYQNPEACSWRIEALSIIIAIAAWRLDIDKNHVVMYQQSKGFIIQCTYIPT